MYTLGKPTAVFDTTKQMEPKPEPLPLDVEEGAPEEAKNTLVSVSPPEGAGVKDEEGKGQLTPADVKYAVVEAPSASEQAAGAVGANSTNMCQCFIDRVSTIYDSSMCQCFISCASTTYANWAFSKCQAFVMGCLLMLDFGTDIVNTVKYSQAGYDDLLAVAILSLLLPGIVTCFATSISFCRYKDNDHRASKTCGYLFGFFWCCGPIVCELFTYFLTFRRIQFRTWVGKKDYDDREENTLKLNSIDTDKFLFTNQDLMLRLFRGLLEDIPQLILAYIYIQRTSGGSGSDDDDSGSGDIPISILLGMATTSVSIIFTLIETIKWVRSGCEISEYLDDG